MVSCGWVVMAFAAGAIFGMLLFAWLEVSREEERKNRHEKK